MGEFHNYIPKGVLDLIMRMHMNGLVIKQMAPPVFGNNDTGSPIFSINSYSAGVSNFFLFFNPLFDQLGDYNWCRTIGDNFDIPSNWFDDVDESKDDPRVAEITDSNLMRLPPKEADEAEYGEDSACEFAAVVDNSYVKKFSKYFRDDHDLILLVKKTLSEELCEKILEYLLTRKKDKAINSILESHVDVVFYNYDGLYWALFAKDKSLIDLTRDHLNKTGKINYAIVKDTKVPQIADLLTR